jgi:ubiquinone/menaquinone biosynthesis C-methylase UbiE
MSKRDWSEKELRNHLIEARKSLWTKEQISRIAKWANFQNNSNVLDVGCGLGYLGVLFADYFSEGKYTGIDISEKLIIEANETYKELDLPLSHNFKVMNAEKIDFPDNTFDIAVCQTVLMHLEDPQKTLNEMVRVVKPGGTVLCFEPDNATSEIKETFNSEFDVTIEDKILVKSVALYRIAGQKKLNRGDWGIGTKLPFLFNNANLTDIDMLQNEKINFIAPPYSLPHQAKYVENMKKFEEYTPKRSPINKRHKEEFLAGGGSEYMYKKYRKVRKKYAHLFIEKINISLEDQSHVTCGGPSLLFACRGIKKKI